MGPLALLILFGLFNDSIDCLYGPDILVAYPSDYAFLLVGQWQFISVPFQAVNFLLHGFGYNHRLLPPILPMPLFLFAIHRVIIPVGS